MRSLPSIAILSLFAAIIVAMPAPVRAAGLTDSQIDAVISLVASFNADSSIVKSVESSLRGTGSADVQEQKIRFEAKTGTSTASATTTDRLKLRSFLSIGSSGEEVKVLQKLLAGDLSLYPEGLVTGFFGPLTELAVKRLQAKLKIDQVGAVGPQTLAKLNELLAGIAQEDLTNSRIKIEIKLKDGREEIKFEVKCDPSGSGNSCKDAKDGDDENADGDKRSDSEDHDDIEDEDEDGRHDEGHNDEDDGGHRGGGHDEDEDD